MIYPPIAAWSAARNKNSKSIPRIPMPIFETVDEARKSLIIEKGNHEYRIKESYVNIDLFDVCWVCDNELYQYTYTKKITGYK